ncbi:1-phosphofructokinase [Adhaeribacter arboris]|uniref:1-phosphofructokinase n=1 Tax=Adhaeribacter arboris TaxID=2072846 RepID=A0A2T2YLA3_9BACT|nr:1-phosphofructokinase family hexose kinase [Adhaeribacter arboris]PSR56245.1 1-phosphofructokinase [Adhaeribacter arboris]
MILCLCPNPSIDMYAWLNTLQAGQANSITKEERFPGGKGVHVALAVAELEEQVMLLGFWGGPTGQWVKENCESKGIECYGPELKDWTRTCLILKSDTYFDDTELLGSGPTISSADFESFRNTFIQILPKADCITMSGSWPKGAPVDAYAQLVSLANKAGKKIFLDCAGEQLNQALIQKPFSVHINRREGQKLFEEESPEQIAFLLAKQCTYAAVTAGADGLYLVAGDELIHAQCPVEDVYSAVGSGDCLLAGLAVAFNRELDIQAVAQLAVACGAANCIRPELGLLYQSDVEILKKQVLINKSAKTSVTNSVS